MPSLSAADLDVRELAISRGLKSLANLAREAGHSRSSADWMQSGSPPTKRLLEDYCRALGVKPSRLLKAIECARERRAARLGRVN